MSVVKPLIIYTCLLIIVVHSVIKMVVIVFSFILRANLVLVVKVYMRKPWLKFGIVMRVSMGFTE